MEKILVTGANGQLGRCIRDAVLLYGDKNQWYFTDITDDLANKTDYLNLTEEKEIEEYITKNEITIIINCAAYTNVDKAENNQETAEGINAIAPLYLATSAKKHDLKLLIHISTDYVFNGTSFMPLTEERMTLPVSVYGKTKLEGEQNIINSGCKYLIFRTAWLYSEYGNNFVKTMMKLIREKESISVVSDQIGTPTYAQDLAELIYHAATQPSIKSGIYHFTNEGVCSWYDFAVHIRNIMRTGYLARVESTTTEKFYGDKPHAKRPYYSVLSKEKVKKDFNGMFFVRNWMDAVEVCVEKLKHNE